MFQDFQWLLKPISVEEFINTYYEKHILHVSDQQPERFLSLFSFRDAETLLWQREAEIPSFVRVNKEGSEIEPSRLRREQDYNRWIQDQYVAGATVILSGLENHWYALAAFLRRIEEFFGGRISVNAYMTPQKAQGFMPHFDTHDAFILQAT